jgi:predicted RNA-binding Zn ribbon-like protein
MGKESCFPGEGRVLTGCAGEGLSLRFVNTLAWRKAAAPEERLPSPAALLDWCAGTGLLDAERASQMEARWEERPREARACHRRALALREAVYGLFLSRILSGRVPEEALRVLNAVLADAPPRVRLAPSGGAFGWWVGPATPASPDVLLAPIAWSAADLLAGPRSHRIRQCADERGCGWLFLDESRAGTRRWCSMAECGNRAKARRHRLRGKHLEPAAPADIEGGVIPDPADQRGRRCRPQARPVHSAEPISRIRYYTIGNSVSEGHRPDRAGHARRAGIRATAWLHRACRDTEFM